VIDHRPIVLLSCGEPIPVTRATLGPYTLWFQRALPEESLGVVDLRDPSEEVPTDVAGYIFMGSPVAVYDDHPWLPRALEATRTIMASGVPTLGVCFGHQLFAVAQGGQVAWNERGVEVGTVQVRLTEAAHDDPLFAGFGEALVANASHDDTVTRLPEQGTPTVLGSSPRDHHQALRWSERVWSVQFHPEMRALETRLAIEWRVPRLEQEGLDPNDVRAAVEEGNDGLTVLRRFAALCRGA
jgi:GMP synthase (glutamine-hydrolysing)